MRQVRKTLNNPCSGYIGITINESNYQVDGVKSVVTLGPVSRPIRGVRPAPQLLERYGCFQY
ncbi:hypothetical protein L537_2396 [Bordetella hinzii 1277]|uniref:Uncharacterized protein n=1 Tax=Bordetella hinzii OH87 BAL007II TaxID=1331262 RepID=A0ABR4R1U5_9BORD|nr:hypothetical protein L543_1772 [Bordetella hinzii L60]KCB24184.1 hypothetical protein L544_2049 [Bordetella hinzii OH87 BAL007II]KCB52294.1 hypothetical protein L537_2396 [Bordetella hinzii 1277]